MRRAPATLLFVGLTALALGGPTSPALAKPQVVSSRLTSFFGPESVAVMQGPGAVEIARLRKDGDHFVIAQVTRPSAVVGGAFRKLLLDAETYDLPSIGESDAKLCGSFEPAIVVRFQRAGTKAPVDMLLAFNCNEAAVAKQSEVPKKLARGAKYGASPNFRADMGPGHLDLLRLALHVFPKDSDFKMSLTEQTSYGRIP